MMLNIFLITGAFVSMLALSAFGSWLLACLLSIVSAIIWRILVATVNKIHFLKAREPFTNEFMKGVVLLIWAIIVNWSINYETKEKCISITDLSCDFTENSSFILFTMKCILWCVALLQIANSIRMLKQEKGDE